LLTRIGKVTALAAAGLLVAAGPAMAHSDDGATDNAKATHGHDVDHQHGGDEGHLPSGGTDNIELVSKLGLSNVEEGGIADVSVYGDYAYLAAWGGQTCKHTGVHVVDISDVSNPVEVGFIPSKEGSYPGEGVQVLSLNTSAFTGDVLVTNNETCKTAGFGGMNIYDVTDPTAPEHLAVGFGDYTDSGSRKKTANEIHSVFAWQAGDRAYAVMVDNEEVEDVDIVDITNPRKPVLIAEYDLMELSGGEIAQPGQDLDEIFLHDMIVKEIDGRFVMLASYWDAGYVQLDVTNPAAASIISDSDFATPDSGALENTDGALEVAPEGNAHQAEFTGDDKFVIGADEDFSPYALEATSDDGTEITASQGSGTMMTPGTTITGQSVFVGRACPGDPAIPAGGEGTQIAIVERGVCDFTVKVAAVEQATGYEAILIFNRTGSDACNASLGMTVEGHTPTFGVAPRQQGFGIFDKEGLYDDEACLAGSTAPAPMAIGDTGDVLTFNSYFDGWGYVRLFTAAGMEEVDTYAIPEAHDPEHATGSGDLSVHEVAVSQQDNGLAYLSYYAGGLRVIDVSSGKIEELGWFIDEGGNNFWGVETFVKDGVEYVALSDRDLGLYIFQYTPTP
jgi:hypothetical protein